jgi:glycosyl transferase family 25
MKDNIKIFVISLRNSRRLPRLRNRLNYLKLKYKIFYGSTGNELKKLTKIFYDKEATIKNINRELSPSEIGVASSHLKIYNYIVKKKIKHAIIMEDDAFPSEMLKEWIKNNINYDNNEILSFYSYPSSSFFKKKPYKKVINNKISIHRFVTHTFNNSCYQINYSTCKKILKITNNKVAGYADWPFLVHKDKINLSVTIPYIAVIDDQGISNIKKIHIKEYYAKKYFPKKLISILRIPYYISFIGFFLKYNNINFYYEHFFLKQWFRVKNLLLNSYINTSKIFLDKNYYQKDLWKIVEKLK